MAHRVNVTPVAKAIPRNNKDKNERVEDPVCKMELDRHDARYMLFRGEQTYYFCSKECQEKFIHPVKTSSGTQAA